MVEMISEDKLIPYHTVDLRYNRVLVLSPHPDDETIGCGGALHLNAVSGSSIRVIFLTNGAKGDEAQEDIEAYVEIRKEEAKRACAILGIDEIDFWDIEDRELSVNTHATQHLIDILKEYGPEIVYAPSPMEIHPDHRAAAFLLESAIKVKSDVDFKVAFYEIGQPIKVNALVDISSVLKKKTEALKCYASQLKMRAYDDICLALNRFRSMTLQESVTHAEGFFLCQAEDIRILSGYNVIRHNGDILLSDDWNRGLSIRKEGFKTKKMKEDDPVVSVIIPTFNRPSELKKAIGSLVSQIYNKLEVIVVNDGGDDVENIVLSFRQDLNIKYLRHSKVKGVAAARNTGINASTGKYIAYLDDDDVYYSNHLSVLVEALESSGYSVAYTDSYKISHNIGAEQDVLAEKSVPYSNDFDSEQLLVSNYIPTLNICHRANVLKDSGLFDESLKYHEDWDLWIRLSFKYRFLHIPAITAAWKKHANIGSSLGTADNDEVLRTLEIIYQRYAYSATANHQLIHKYLFIKKLIKNKKVLDLFSGTLNRDMSWLSNYYEQADCVFGLYQDEPTIKAFSDEFYYRKGSFVCGWQCDIPFKDQFFDIIICFDPPDSPRNRFDKFIYETKRLLKSDGILVISMISKEFSERLGFHENTHYRKGMKLERLESFLLDHFGHVSCWGQDVFSSSYLFPFLKDTGFQNPFFLKNIRIEDVVSNQNKEEVREIVALASKKSLPEEFQGSPEPSFLLEENQSVKRYQDRLIDHLIFKIITNKSFKL